MFLGKLLALMGLLEGCATAPPYPNLIMLLQDDLGYYDVGWNNPSALDVSGNITMLAKSGVILTRHYVHYWCAPTRRSFLSGRLPIHHGEMLSSYTSDDLDLRWNLISQKLKARGYRNYWFGKGHTGYKSMAHLPTSRGFDNHTGFLIGEQKYTSTDRWLGQAPLNTDKYSSALFGDAALHALESHDAAVPFFLYLAWQAVHTPYDPVPGWLHNDNSTETYRGMFWLADVYVGRLVALLRKRGIWDNTLLVFSSDNGGHGDGINYPYRGEKRTNYEGGVRVPAFVSGGFLPSAVRGTSSDIRFHIVDWYATFCKLAGADPTDGPPVPPKAVPASDPPPTLVPICLRPGGGGPDWKPSTDIYGNASWPDVDGVDIWDMINKPAKYNRDSAHPVLVLSRDVILSGPWKLMVAQRGPTCQPHDSFEAGWRYPNYTWVLPKERTCGEVNGSWKATQGKFVPCLFDLDADPREEFDLSARNSSLRDRLWRTLDDTWRTYYHARSPPHLLGHCNPVCAALHWKSLHGQIGHGPECGVPACGGQASPELFTVV